MILFAPRLLPFRRFQLWTEQL